MILRAFAKHIQEYAADVPLIILLNRWLKDILQKPPQNNVERIIHAELTLIQDKNETYSIVGTTRSGQKLLENLYRYVQSLENQDFSRWLHEINPNDFDENTL